MDSVFDRDTAVSHEGDGLFAATIASGWRAGRGPHGGYLAAMLLKALIAQVDDSERTPRSLTIHYARAPEPGPIEILVTVEREGRSLTTLSARMQQGGRVTALALSAFSVPWRAPGANELPMPDLAPPDEGSRPLLGEGRADEDRRLDRPTRASSGRRTRFGFVRRRLVSSVLHRSRLARNQPHDRPHDPFPPRHLPVLLRSGRVVPERVRDAPAV